MSKIATFYQAIYDDYVFGLTVVELAKKYECTANEIWEILTEWHKTVSRGL